MKMRSPIGIVGKTMRYDNMTSVVKRHVPDEADAARIQRVETDGIIAFRSHCGYRTEYCNPASRREKTV